MVHHFGYGGSIWWLGPYGVQIFFVISGFVITNSAQDVTPTGFLKSRFIRLAPSIWICGSATLIVLALRGQTDLGRSAINTLILWPFGPWLDRVYWSLPVEIVFYTAVFLMLVARKSVELLLRGLAAMSALYWLFEIYATSTGGHCHGLILLPFGGEFALGGLLYLCIAEKRIAGRAVFIAIAVAASLTQIIFQATREAVAVPLAASLLWLAATTAIVAAAHWNDAATRLFARQAKVVRLIGLATYPLYLLHHEVGVAAITVLGASPWLVMAMMIAASIGVAAYIEPVIQRGLKAWLSLLASSSPYSVGKSAVPQRADHR